MEGDKVPPKRFYANPHPLEKFGRFGQMFLLLRSGQSRLVRDLSCNESFRLSGAPLHKPLGHCSKSSFKALMG